MPRRVKVCQEAVRSVIETLEQRVLLTTIIGGGVDPVTGLPIVTQARYVDAAGHVAVISVGGNTTAEFIFAHVPMMSGAISTLGDLVPPPPPNMTVMGDDLYSIYVAQSDASSFISVTEVRSTTFREAQQSPSVPTAGRASSSWGRGPRAPPLATISRL